MFVDNITLKIDDDLNLNNSIQKFWEVENVGVHEHFVYENFKQAISLLYHLDHFIDRFLTITYYQTIDFLF